jgi:Flp pilus assembly protein TadD
MRNFLCLCAAALILSACATSGNREAIQNAVDSLDMAVFEGTKAPETALDAYRALYKKYPRNAIAVAAYADALRRGGNPQSAAGILKPFVKDADVKKLDDPIFLAYMRLMIDQGFYKDAEERLRRRMTLPANKFDGQASIPQISNLLGITLASQGRDAEARQAFQVAQANWDGRPGVVEKNLSRLTAKPKK